MADNKEAPKRFLRVYRSEPRFNDYLKARFGSGNVENAVFEFGGEHYRFKHSSTDAQGMFDVLEMVDDAQAKKP